MNFEHAFNEVLSVDSVIAGIVFLAVCGTIAFAVIRYRAGRGHEPSKKSKHPIGEPLYASLLVVVALGLALFAANLNSSERAGLGKPQLRVMVTAFQWCWRFHYEGTNVTVSGTCVTKADDPVLVLPVGENVKVLLTSADVVHEWWVPAFDWKMEAFPNHTNSFDLKLTKAGSWVGRCSVFCGLYHYRMDFRVRALPAAAFRSWLAAQHAGTPS